MSRREYDINLYTNKLIISKIIIDTHYEEKHSESIDDEIILSLAQQLNNDIFEPVDIKGKYQYFVTEKRLDDKNYRLVWLLEDGEIYIGIVNAFRRS